MIEPPRVGVSRLEVREERDAKLRYEVDLEHAQQGEAANDVD
jgi:hypothetical protein